MIKYFKRPELILIIIIILLAAFLRLYRISEYMAFLGDEGRDMLVAKDILNAQLTLLGPRSSAGDFYMGPFYYYLITPFVLFANYDPVGPAIMVALFGVATVILIYYCAKKFFNTTSAFFAAALYSVSILVLAYSHSSWNPNILPFFSLLLIYTLYYTIKNQKPWKYYILVGLLLGICLQLHYLSLFLAVTIFVYIFLTRWLTNSNLLSSRFKNYFAIIAGASISLSPFFFFELRHNFLNTKGIIAFIFGNTVSYSPSTNFFTTAAQVFFRIFARLVFNFPSMDKTANFSQTQLVIWGGLSLILAVTSIIALFRHKNKSISLLLGLWLFISVLLFGLYKKEIYDYLFTFIFPLPFLLIGNLLSVLYHLAHGRLKRNAIHDSSQLLTFLFPLFSLSLFFIILAINILGLLSRAEPNNQRDQARKIAEFVISKSDNKPYNFALLSPGNSDHAYRYYLEILGAPPVTLENLEKDPKHKTVTSQLLIICEDIRCNPIGHPLHEVAAFGRAEIAGVWNFSVVKVYRLIHYEE